SLLTSDVTRSTTAFSWWKWTLRTKWPPWAIFPRIITTAPALFHLPTDTRKFTAGWILEPNLRSIPIGCKGGLLRRITRMSPGFSSIAPRRLIPVNEALGFAGVDPARRARVSFVAACLSSGFRAPTPLGEPSSLLPPMVVVAGDHGVGARRTFGGAGAGSQPAPGDASSAGDDHRGRGFDDERVGGGRILLDL